MAWLRLVLLLLALLANQAADEQKDKISPLVPLFLNGTVSSDFFVSQLASANVEKSVLKSTARKVRADWKVTTAKLLGQSLSDSEKEAERLRFKNSTRALIEASLTNEQLDVLINVATQRQKVIDARCRNFEYPVFFALKVAGQTSVEHLKTDFEAIRKSYEEKKSEEFRRCVEKIKRTGVNFEGFFELVQLHQAFERIDARSISNQPANTINWGDDEFANYQSEREALYINNSGSKNLAPLLDMTDEQIQQVSQAVKDARAKRNPDDFVDPGYARIILGMNNDSLKGLQSEIRKKLELTGQLEQELANEIADKILVPEQTKKARRIAKFSRDLYESKLGDEFGAIVAWIDAQEEIKHDEKNRLLGMVIDERSKFHKQMRVLRSNLCRKVLVLLPDEVRQEFIAKYGKRIYDVDAEKVSKWDEARRSRRP